MTENEANQKEWRKGESSVMLIEVLSQVIPEAYCLFLSVIIRAIIYFIIYTLYWRRKWQPTPVSCLENPMDRGVWWVTVHGVAESQIRLSDI